MENIDLTKTVDPTAATFISIGGMILLSFIFILMFIIIKRYKGKMIPALLGIVSYIVFCFMGYLIITNVFLMLPGMADSLNNNPTTATVIFLVIMVTMFTLARIVASKIMAGRFDGVGDIFNAGLGIGLCEVVLFGITLLTMMVWSRAITTDGLEVLFADFTETEIISTYESIEDLLITPGYFWLLLAISYVKNMILQIGLMIIDNGAMSGKLPKWWIFVTTAMNFVVVLPYQLYDSTSVNGIVVPFAIKTVLFIVSCYVIYQVNVRYLDNIIGSDVGKVGLSKKEMPKFGKLSNK